MKRILVELTEDLQAEIDAFRHAEEDKAQFSISRQKIIVKLLKKGLEYGK